MIHIMGGYLSTILKDGTGGNYHAAQEYFTALTSLKRYNAQLFNNLADYVQQSKKLLQDEDVIKSHLYQAGIRNDNQLPEFYELVKLSTERTIGSQVAAIFDAAAKPSYNLVSPFKNPRFGNPGEVAAKYVRNVVMEYMGPSDALTPGKTLRP